MTPTHALLLVALLEVAINRVAVPLLRPAGTPPAWHTALDYLGLFSFYFAGTLSALLALVRGWHWVRGPADRRQRAAGAALLVASGLAAVPLVIDPPGALSATLEVAFIAGVVLLVVASYGRSRDLGVAVGLPLVAAPFALHSVGVIGGRFLWPDNTFDGIGYVVATASMLSLCLAALSSPYCFAPRPFARAVTRPAPIVAAIATSLVGAWLARASYPVFARGLSLALGLELTTTRGDPRLPLYMLAFATMVWTLVSCAGASTATRRAIGLGLTFVVLGGNAFKWPHHYLLPLVGLAVLAEAARGVRDDERAALPFHSATPPITDAAWSGFLTVLVAALRRPLANVHALTSRGDAGLASTLLVGDADGVPVRIRIDRVDGCVLALDVVVGRERDEQATATVTVWSVPPRALGSNPASPPAAPGFRSGDAEFDLRFRLRGSEPAFGRLFDGELRARAAATLDGWLAYWDDAGLRYRVYPGRGAPLDHPLPLSDLALGRAPESTERLVAVVELLLALARRVELPALAAAGDAEPLELAAPTIAAD